MKMPFTKTEKWEVKRLPEPELKRIPIENLKFAAYQRQLKKSKVRKIKENFCPDIVGIALVSFRSGEFWCMDAQHRVMALKEMGFKEIWCQIITGLTYEQECKRFNILNTGRTQLTANQVFHCRVEEKDIDATTLVDLFKKYGFDYNKNASAKDDNLIGAVSKFVKMQDKYGNSMVEQVLRVLRKSWLGDKDSLSTAIITGLSTFLGDRISVDEDLLINALSHISPKELEASASAFMKFGVLRLGRGDGTCYHIAKQIGELYDSEVNKPQRGRPRKMVV